MANCKDCFHFDVCMDYTSLKDSKFAQEFNETDILCEHYKAAADVAEVRHGEWEKFEIPHMMRCSECGVSDLDIHRTKFAFCHNCGAKMDGKGESTCAGRCKD